jgi:hypothetical protein
MNTVFRVGTRNVAPDWGARCMNSFVKMSALLEFCAERLRPENGKYRDRKKSSFDGLQAINRQRHFSKECFDPPVGHIEPNSTA